MSVVNIVCPGCFVRNRVPEARLDDAPRCGICHRPLFDSTPVQVNTDQFERMIRDNDIPVVVDFWAEWCGPCKMFAPVYEQAAESLEPRVRLLKLDTEANREVAARYQIRSIPTLAIFRKGTEKTRQSGAMPLGAFLDWAKANAA
jgi:thioredoxin 2